MKILITNLRFFSPGFSGLDFPWFPIKFVLKTNHFGALAILDLFWGCLGPSWACFGHVLGYLGLVMSCLGPILHHLRDVVGLSWAILCLNPWIWRQLYVFTNVYFSLLPSWTWQKPENADSCTFLMGFIQNSGRTLAPKTPNLTTVSHFLWF